MYLGESDFYHGCVFAQLSKAAPALKIAPIVSRASWYELNDRSHLLILAPCSDGPEWRFDIPYADTEFMRVTQNSAYVAFVCGNQFTCALAAATLLRLAPPTTANFSVRVTAMPDDIVRIIERAGFGTVDINADVFPPALLGEELPEEKFCWPVGTTLRVYSGRPNLEISSTDGEFDIADLLTASMTDDSIEHARVGVTLSTKMSLAEQKKYLSVVEDRIQYLFEFDGFGVDLKRESCEPDHECIEFLWHLEYWYAHCDNDPLYNMALAHVRETGSASNSMLQRRLGIGVCRAERLLTLLEKADVVSPVRLTARDVV